MHSHSEDLFNVKKIRKYVFVLLDTVGRKKTLENARQILFSIYYRCSSQKVEQNHKISSSTTRVTF